LVELALRPRGAVRFFAPVRFLVAAVLARVVVLGRPRLTAVRAFAAEPVLAAARRRPVVFAPARAFVRPAAGLRPRVDFAPPRVLARPRVDRAALRVAPALRPRRAPTRLPRFGALSIPSVPSASFIGSSASGSPFIVSSPRGMIDLLASPRWQETPEAWREFRKSFVEIIP